MEVEVIQKRDKILQYVEGVLTGGLTKKQAYTKFIDKKVKDVNSAIRRLERKKEYQDIYTMVSSDENYKFQAATKRVQGKYLNLIEKNIDTSIDMLDAAKDGAAKDKAMAVRLTNETVQAMAVVANPAPANDPNSPAINKAGVIS